MTARLETRELVQYLEGELTQARAAEVEVQLAASPELRKELDTLKSITGRLATPDPALAGVDLVPGLRTALAERAPARSSPWRWFVGAGFALAAGAAAALLVVRTPPLDDGFHAKGAPATDARRWVGVEAYAFDGSRKLGRVAASLPARAGLAFAYRNGGSDPFTHLALFAVDGSGRLFWYYPAWENPSEDPVSVPIRPSQEAVDLPEVVRQDYAPGPLHLHALFTRQPVHVSEVEARLHAAPGKALELPDAVDQELDLRVEP